MRGDPMDERTRQLVLVLVGKAHAGALATLEQELAGLPPGERQAVEDGIEALRACLLRQLQGTLLPGAAAERIAALIHGRQAPASVALMEGYARLLVGLLTASRNELTSVRKTRDN